ncbi:MAG: hypothetical protein IT198_08875 [Acidimicrobiia bacterium]|nr:hypothetical protein [Acidimicrobiia bacterium]
MPNGRGGFLLKAAGATMAAAGAMAAYRAGRTESRIDERINPILDGDVPPGSDVAPPPPAPPAGTEPVGEFAAPPAMTPPPAMYPPQPPHTPSESAVVIWPGGAEQAGPLVPVIDAPGLPVPYDGAAVAASTYARSRGGRRYALGGTVLGSCLGLLTALALVLAGIAAVQRDEKKVNMETQGSSASGEGGGTTDYNTSGGSTKGSSSAGTAGSTTGTGGSTGGQSSNTGSGGGDGGGAGGGGGGGSGGGGSGVKRPPQGKWAAAGEGSEAFSAGNVRNSWSDMTFEVIYDGDCWIEKMTMHSKRWAELLFCPTNDGGLVLSLTRTYNIMPVLSLGEIHNLATTKCEPVRVYMSGNMEAGQQLNAGSCVNTNEQCGKGFTGCKVSPLIPDSSVDQATVTVIGKEVVSGQEAWHVQMNQSMVSQTGKVQGSVITVDPHNQEHFWFRTTDGLPLRMDRVTNAKTTTTVGIVSTFKETGSMWIAEPPPVS